MKRLKQAEIVPEEFGLASKSVRQTPFESNHVPRTSENDIEIVIYRCMGWLHLHPATRPLSLEQLWLAIGKMSCCTYIVDPKVILFHLILNNYLCLEGEGDKQTVSVSTTNRFDSDGLRIFVPDEPMFSGIDTKVSADFTLTLCKVIHWLFSLHSATQHDTNNGGFGNGMNQEQSNNAGFGFGQDTSSTSCFANSFSNNGFGGNGNLFQNNAFSNFSQNANNCNNGFANDSSHAQLFGLPQPQHANDDDEMTPEFTSPFAQPSPVQSAPAPSTPWLFSVLLSAFMTELSQQCVIRKNVDPRLVIEHFQCRGLIHVDGESGSLEYHLPALPPKPSHYMALPSDEYELSFPSGR